MVVSPIVIIVLLLGLCFSALFIYILLSSRHRKAGAGNLDLLGMIARVETTLEPEGAIILDGELWRARVLHPTSPVRPGHTVRIVGANGHFLLVSPMD